MGGMTQTTTQKCPGCNGLVSGPRQSQQSLTAALTVHADTCPANRKKVS